MSSEVEVRRLTDLRVVDLRAELEKRGLEKAGVKATLIERLSKALKDEGKDPEVYEFERPKRNSSTNAESESDVSFIAEEIEKVDDFPKELQNDKDMDDSKGNGNDNDDSINITIEEDEDQLLTDDIDESQRSMERDDMKNVPATVEDEPHEEASSETAEKQIEPTDEREETGSGVGGETEAASADLKADTSGGNSSKATSAAEKPESSTTTPASTSTSRSQPPTEPNSASSQNAAKPDKDTMGNSSAASRSLWVAGLATVTRATDLKRLLSKYGKVVGAKVVTNARMPSARCYGYVVMATVEDAENCIKYAHRTELHGRFITINKAQADKNEKAAKEKERRELEAQKLSEKSNSLSDSIQKSKIDDLNKTSASVKSDCNKSISGEKKNDSLSKDGSVKRDDKSLSRDRSRRTSEGSTRARARMRDERLSSRERFRRRTLSRGGKEVLSLKQIIEERERQRLRERERYAREAEQRRRREEQVRSRELDRRHKEESKRLERERERLRIERERLQREKADLIRLERKKLEQEFFELQQRKLEVVRRVQKRAIPDSKDPFPDNRKRMNVSTSNRYDVPPPSQHYEMPSRSNQPPDSLSSKKHEMYKREEYKLREEYKPREMDIRNRDLRGGPRDEYKMRDEYGKGREDVRGGRDDIRGNDDPRARDEYSKHDRPDFPPPPPRISGPNIPSKYNSPDSPYTSSNRPSRDMMRREPMPPGAMSSVRNNYSDGSGGPGDARNSPPTGPYRPSRDDRDSRRPEPDHRPNKSDLRSHDNRYSDMPSLKDYPDRDAGGWHNSTVMKSFGSMSGPGGGGSSGIRDPWIKNEPPQMGGSGQWGNSNARLESSDRWMNTPSSRMLSGPPGVGSYGGAGGSSLLPPGVTSSSYMSDQRYDSHKSSAWVLH